MIEAGKKGLFKNLGVYFGSLIQKKILPGSYIKI